VAQPLLGPVPMRWFLLPLAASLSLSAGLAFAADPLPTKQSSGPRPTGASVQRVWTRLGGSSVQDQKIRRTGLRQLSSIMTTHGRRQFDPTSGGVQVTTPTGKFRGVYVHSDGSIHVKNVSGDSKGLAYYRPDFSQERSYFVARDPSAALRAMGVRPGDRISTVKTTDKTRGTMTIEVLRKTGPHEYEVIGELPTRR